MGSKANWSPALPPQQHPHNPDPRGSPVGPPPPPLLSHRSRAGTAPSSRNRRLEQPPPPSPARPLSHGWLCQGDVGVLSPTAESQAWAGAGSRAGWGSRLPPHPGIPNHPPPLPLRPGKPGRDGMLDLIHGCNNLAGLSLQVNQPPGAGWVLGTGQGAASPSWAPRGWRWWWVRAGVPSPCPGGQVGPGGTHRVTAVRCSARASVSLRAHGTWGCVRGSSAGTVFTKSLDIYLPGLASSATVGS